MAKSATFQQTLVLVYRFLLCLFFGEVFSAQILGMAGLYRGFLPPLFTLLTALVAFIIYTRWDSQQFLKSFPNPAATAPLLDHLAAAAGCLILLGLIWIPTGFWPLTPISDVLHWDAGAYHLPKAVELFRTGNVWDLSIPYGEYPFGFESLFSFVLVLTGDERLYGLVTLLIGLFFILNLWLLARRYTRLPGGLLWLVTLLIVTSELITVKGNPFYIFLDQIYMVGKNDLFTAVGVMSAILHAPIGRSKDENQMHLPGLVYSSLLVLATKPAGMFVVAPLWLLVLFQWVQNWLNARNLPWKEIGFAALCILPGAAWIVRNLLLIGVIFPEGVWIMADWSISNNLTNPFFYAHLPRNFQFLLAVVGLTLLFAIWKRVPYWRIAATFIVLLVAFAFTPESAFQKTTQEPTRTAWRLGIALVAYEWTMLLCLVDGLLAKPLGQFFASLQKQRRAQTVVGVMILAAVCGFIFQNRFLLEFNPQNSIVLRDEFRDPAGVDGYHSVYDYVQRNLRHKTIQIEGGVFYYLYGPGFTNSPTKLHYPLGRSNQVKQLEPEYYVVVNRPEFTPGETFKQTWVLLYEDETGKIYQKRVH